jgi:hypothetical protein
LSDRLCEEGPRKVRYQLSKRKSAGWAPAICEEGPRNVRYKLYAIITLRGPSSQIEHVGRVRRVVEQSCSQRAGARSPAHSPSTRRRSSRRPPRRSARSPRLPLSDAAPERAAAGAGTGGVRAPHVVRAHRGDCGSTRREYASAELLPEPDEAEELGRPPRRAARHAPPPRTARSPPPPRQRSRARARRHRVPPPRPARRRARRSWARPPRCSLGCPPSSAMCGRSPRAGSGLRARRAARAPHGRRMFVTASSRGVESSRVRPSSARPPRRRPWP